MRATRAARLLVRKKFSSLQERICVPTSLAAAAMRWFSSARFTPPMAATSLMSSSSRSDVDTFLSGFSLGVAGARAFALLFLGAGVLAPLAGAVGVAAAAGVAAVAEGAADAAAVMPAGTD